MHHILLSEHCLHVLPCALLGRYLPCSYVGSYEVWSLWERVSCEAEKEKRLWEEQVPCTTLPTRALSSHHVHYPPITCTTDVHSSTQGRWGWMLVPDTMVPVVHLYSCDFHVHSHPLFMLILTITHQQSYYVKNTYNPEATYRYYIYIQPSSKLPYNASNYP